MKRLALLLLLALSAVGCTDDQQRCKAACAPRAMHEITLWSCVCESSAAHSDGGR